MIFCFSFFILECFVFTMLDCNMPSELFSKLIHNCINGDLHTLKQLLEENKDIDIDSDNGRALVSASALGRDEIVSFLLESGASPNIQDGMALILAVKNNHFTTCKKLLEFGASPILKDGLAIKMACININHSIIELIILHGYDFNNKSGEDKSASHIFRWISRFGLLDSLISLQNSGVKIDNFVCEILHGSIFFGRKEIIQWLFDDVKINPELIINCTALEDSLIVKDYYFIEVLLKELRRAGLLRFSLKRLKKHNNEKLSIFLRYHKEKRHLQRSTKMSLKSLPVFKI